MCWKLHPLQLFKLWMKTVRCQVKPSVRGFIDFQNYFRDTSENVWQPLCNSVLFIPPQRKMLSGSLPPKAGSHGHSKGRLGGCPHQQWFKHQKEMTTVGLLGALQEWLPSIALTTQHFRTEVELQWELGAVGGRDNQSTDIPFSSCLKKVPAFLLFIRGWPIIWTVQGGESLMRDIHWWSPCHKVDPRAEVLYGCRTAP